MANEYPLDSDSITKQIVCGGIQVEFPFLSNPLQIIYLDFDGELTKYRNADLNVEIDGVQVEHSILTPERIAGIVASLNAEFAGQNVLFVTERPKDTAYSTIFVGKTSAFDQYGKFAGLAETVDHDNRIPDDNAFVLLDASYPDSDIVSTITHEAGHLLGTLDHGGDGLRCYAALLIAYYVNNCTLTEDVRGYVSLLHRESSRTIGMHHTSIAGDHHSYYSAGEFYDVARNVNILSGGTLHVGYGGKAYNVVNVSSGCIYIDEGGEANHTTGTVSVCSGGIVNYTTGFVYVSSGGKANYTTGGMTVSSGGIANNTMVIEGCLSVGPGGVANDNSVTSGQIIVASGGTANRATVNIGGSMAIKSGGTATGIVENGGCVRIDNDAEVTFTPNTFYGVALNDSATVHAGTTAFSTTIKNDGSLWVYSGGIANNTTIISSSIDDGYRHGRGYLEIHGGIANNAIVNDGVVNIWEGCANDTTVNSSGLIYVYFGGAANNTTVNSAGSMMVVSSGTALNTIENGGYVDVEGASKATFASNTFTGLVLSGTWEERGDDENWYYIPFSSARATVHSGTTANSTVIKELGALELYDGGVANNTVVESGGSLVFTGGAGYANGTVINAGGSVKPGTNCVMNYTTINKGGTLEARCVVNNITVNSGGCFRFYGSSATDIVENGGYVDVSYTSDVVSFASNTFTGLTLSGEWTQWSSDYKTLTSTARATVHSGTTANDITVDVGGLFYIYSGGVANRTTVTSGVTDPYAALGGSMFVYSGAIANDATVIAGGNLTVYSGGIANDATVNANGRLFVYSGGTANSTTVNCGGELWVYYRGTAINIVENGGQVSDDYHTATFLSNSFSGLVLSNTHATVHSGTTANQTAVVESGFLYVYSGGIANSTTVNTGGGLYVSSGGIVKDVDVAQGGTLSLAGAFLDGTITVNGTMNLYGTVFVRQGGTIILDGTVMGTGTLNFLIGGEGPQTAESALLSNYGLLKEHGTISVTVEPSTYDSGSYVLADKAANYFDAMLVYGLDGEKICTLAAGDTYQDETYIYSLSLESEQLIFNFRAKSGVEVYDDDELTSSGEMMSDVVLNADGDNLMKINSGGTATHTTAGADTKIIVSSGGTATDSIINGGALMTLEDGAVMEGTTELTGTIKVESGATVSAGHATINLIVDGMDVLGKEQHVGYVSSLNSLSGASLSITVTENAKPGNSYAIAGNADGFTSDVVLTVTGEESSRNYSFVWDSQTQIYTPIVIDDNTYSLWFQTDEQSGNTCLYLTIADPIPDAAYEYIAHVLSYKEGHENNKIGDSIHFQIGENDYDFIVRGIYDDESTAYGIGGFDAILLERTDAEGNSLHQAVLGCGGTEQLISDIISDADPRGIGYHQFFSNADDVYSDCKELADDGCLLSMTGHSLGGALAQWFALYGKTRGGIGQIEDVVTFNSPGISMTVNQLPIPISSSNKTDIKNVRYYIGDGDLVSMAGEWYVPGNNAQYIISNFYSQYYTTHESAAGLISYFGDQHTTFYFDNDGKLKNNIKTGPVSELSSGLFSYLTLLSSEPADKFPNIVSVRNEGQNNYYLFNTQYAKYALILANGKLDLANRMVIRKKVEDFRKEVLPGIIKYLSAGKVIGWGNILTYIYRKWKGNDYKKVNGAISVGNDNLTSTDGSTHGRIIRTLSYGEQNAPQLLFDFTNQEFIKLFQITPEIIAEITPATSELFIKMVLEEKGNQWVCFNIPALDESARYMLVKAMTNTGVVLSEANYFKKGSTWYIIDDPATEYTFTFSVDNSVTTEKAVLLPESEAIDKETDKIELFISDIDAASSGNTGSISVQVKTVSNPDGMTVVLQESDVAGLFRGTVSVTSLNLTDDDDKLTIVYEDADNGTGVAETIEKVIDIISSDSQDAIPDPPENLNGTAEKVSWEPNGAIQYVVEYSKDNFEHVISVVTSGDAIDTPDLPAGTYQWRVKADGGEDWATGGSIIVSEAENESAAPKVVRSNDDGNDDLFFASANGTWESIYYAQHVGSINDWSGTNELVSANGKGRIRNLFFGSSDPNVLCLTDGENGDAIFVDDVYTDLPEEIEEHTARLYRIQEIRAGAGDDIVDMTSQRFEYVGSGMIIRGGDGDDVIWANKGDNFLFGDAGNDRIVGASGNDVIAGGIGNDRMHGGGGDDIFAFGENWGSDIVEQLATGFVTLWFASGSEENWNAETLTYTDGDNSVTISGVTADKITLKFGDDGSDQFAMLSGMGAFADFTSERIFEESGKGMLAST